MQLVKISLPRMLILSVCVGGVCIFKEQKSKITLNYGQDQKIAATEYNNGFKPRSIARYYVISTLCMYFCIRYFMFNMFLHTLASLFSFLQVIIPCQQSPKPLKM